MFILKIFLSIFLLQIINCQQAIGSSYPIQAAPMYEQKERQKDQEIINKELVNLFEFINNEKLKLNSDSSSDDFIPIREKKKKEPTLEDDTSPLINHRRKSFTSFDQSTVVDQVCLSRLNSFESNKIIDTKLSLQRGAKFLKVEKIESQSKKNSLIELQESCVRQCCSTDSCDTGLLSLKQGEVRYK